MTPFLHRTQKRVEQRLRAGNFLAPAVCGIKRTSSPARVSQACSRSTRIAVELPSRVPGITGKDDANEEGKRFFSQRMASNSRQAPDVIEKDVTSEGLKPKKLGGALGSALGGHQVVAGDDAAFLGLQGLGLLGKAAGRSLFL